MQLATAPKTKHAKHITYNIALNITAYQKINYRCSTIFIIIFDTGWVLDRPCPKKPCIASLHVDLNT